MRRLTFAFGAILLLLVAAGSAFALTTVRIGDTVWINTNGDSVKDADEPGIGGATVSLAYVMDGAWVDLATTTTASDGTYKFAGLTPGYDYRVTVALPVGYEAYAANFDRDYILIGYLEDGIDGGKALRPIGEHIVNMDHYDRQVIDISQILLIHICGVGFNYGAFYGYSIS